MVRKDKKLTAKWADADEELITVTFDTDGGIDIPELNIVKGEKITLPQNPTKEGYDFKYWVDKDGNKFNEENPIEENITLKAIWEKKKDDKKDDKNKQNTTTTQPEQQQIAQPTQQQTNNQPENKSVDATGISLNKSTVDLIIGNSDSLTATVTPDNAKDKSVTWSSSDSSVISVDGSGNLKANAIGSAVITAKTVNGKTATATVYSDVQSISLSASRTYISKYNGATSSTTLTVTTSPAVDASLIKWNAPDASGQNAAAYFSGSGTSATITARDVWGSNNSSIPVTVYVGRKTSNKITIYVEPQLSISVNPGNQIKEGTQVQLSSNIPVKYWNYSTETYATVLERTNTYTKFTAKNPYTGIDHAVQGFQITTRSNAGQNNTTIITVTKQ